MFFLHCRWNILRYEQIFCETDESIATYHDPSSDVIFLGVHRESISPFMEYFFSQENCVSFGFLVFCLLLSQSAQILLVNLLWGVSWKFLFCLEQYCKFYLMNLIQLINCWKADDEFSWNNFYFTVVKEFLYGKKY